ncbi:MAG TPA: DJ-1/PfpI family protein [Gemmatimonadaceae bacterium]|nr:DJ-1/PfpI family protein [Gemmatimonadaceae bacterium]
MMRGLADRRVAVFVASQDDSGQRRADAVIKALVGAGAREDVLSTPGFSDSDFASGRYAALILVGDGGSQAPDPRVVQLAREFLASEKPVAVWGALRAILEAGGARGRRVAGDAPLRATLEQAGATWVDEPMFVDEELITAGAGVSGEEFAARVTKEFADRLDERALDEMSELSFPASDPPAVSPSFIGSAGRERSGDT